MIKNVLPVATLGIGVFWSMAAAAQQPQPAPASLAEGPAFAYVNATSDVSEKSAGIKPSSINVDVLLALLEERAERAAVQAISDVLARTGAATGLPAYVRDLLTEAAGLVSPKNGFQRARIDAIARICVRALAAEAIVRSSLSPGGRDAQELLATLGVLIPSDDKKLGTFLRDWTYYALGQAELLADRRSTPPPCPWKDDEGSAAACKAIVKIEPRKLLSTMKLDLVLDGLRLASKLRTDTRADVVTVLESAVTSTSIASFTSTPGVTLASWLDSASTLEGRVALLETDRGAVSAQLHAVTNAIDARARLEQTGEAAAKQNAEEAIKTAATRLVGTLGDAAKADNVTRILTVMIGEQQAAKDIGSVKAWATKLGTAPWPPSADAALLLRLDVLSTALFGKSTQAYTDLTNLRGAAADIAAIFKTIATPAGPDQLAVDRLPFGLIALLKQKLDTAKTALQDLATFAAEYGFDSGAFAKAATMTLRVDEILTSFDDLDAVLAAKVGTLGASLDRLQRVGVPLFQALEPIADKVATSRSLDADSLVKALAAARVEDLAQAFGVDIGSTETCGDEGDSAAGCWLGVVLRSLKDSINIDGKDVKIDGDKLGHDVASIGDDFRRTKQGRWFFHLTIGAGGLVSGTPPAVVGNMEQPLDTRFVPYFGEQVGFGWATRTYCDAINLKVGAFASGLLYRLVIDSAESKSVMFGLFGAMDLYQDIELYVAPSILLYPPIDNVSIPPRPALGFGVQVPLSDYLTRLK